jgi:hypothetical protein
VIITGRNHRAGRGIPVLRSGLRSQSARLVLLAGAVAVGLAACGGGASATPSASASSSGKSTTPTTGAAPQARPGASGQVASVSGSTLEVQNPQVGQTTVTLTSSTTITQLVMASASALSVGECVAAIGAPDPTGAIAARTVSITPQVNGTCAPANALGGFGLGRARQGGAAGAGGAAPNGTAPARRLRNRGQFGGAFGKLTSVSATGLQVQAAAGLKSVTVSSTTRYTQLQSAAASSLAVGQCVTAFGPVDSTGAVTARSVSIRPAGPNGCVAGAGGGGGFGNGGAAANAGTQA